MQNGQRFLVMYLLYRGADMLATFETVAGGDRTKVQEQGDRQDTRERQTDAAAAGETVAARRGWKRKVYIPEADEDHTQSEVRARAGAGIPARDLPEYREGDPSVSGRAG